MRTGRGKGVRARNSRPGPGDGGEVARFWDANRQRSKDPAFWMAHPLCRQAINWRVTGSAHEWPLDAFRRYRASEPFELGLSIGCGLGPFERAAMRCGLARRIHAIDLSERSLQDARVAAREEGLEGIDYVVGDFNDPVLPKRAYDAVFFHASLHHVAALERLFRRLCFALRPGGAIYVDEYVGPSRAEWTQAHLVKAQALLDTVPAAAKTADRIALPIQEDDPSEAVRSSEIPRFLRRYFTIVDWRPYGGQLAALLFPYLDGDWAASPEATPFIQSMLAMEDEELRSDPETSHHVVAYGRLKPGSALGWPMAGDAVGALLRRVVNRIGA